MRTSAAVFATTAELRISLVWFYVAGDFSNSEMESSLQLFYVKVEFWALVMYCLHQWLSWNDVGDGEDIVMSLIISVVYLQTQLIQVQHHSVTESPYGVWKNVVISRGSSNRIPCNGSFPLWRHTISWLRHDVTSLSYLIEKMVWHSSRLGS